MKNLKENNVYFYFEKNKLIKNFNNFSKLGNIYYPLKTNSNVNIIKTLKPLIEKENNGFLISSIEHFEILKNINANPKNICLMNVLSGNDTIKYLYDNGVRFFTFDNFNSLKLFSKYADLANVKISVRLSTMQIFNNYFSHLGGTNEECRKMIEFLKDKCSDYGISFYIQEELKKEENVLKKIITYIQENYNDLGINFISIGGINSYEEIKIERLENIKSELKINQIILEVGRYLVEDTIDMQTTIIREKKINNQKIVIIKNGIYSGLLDILLYNKKFKIYLKSKDGKEIELKYNKTSIDDCEFYMCGGSADSKDKIGLMYINSKYKDELVEGTKIYIKQVGAYVEEFFMAYRNDLNKVFVEV